MGAVSGSEAGSGRQGRRKERLGARERSMVTVVAEAAELYAGTVWGRAVEELAGVDVSRAKRLGAARELRVHARRSNSSGARQQ